MTVPEDPNYLSAGWHAAGVDNRSGAYTTVAVTDMFVECSLQVRNFEARGIAMSDCCREHATSVVEMENGNQMFRCEEHKGIRRLQKGPVRLTIQKRVHN